MGSMGGLPPPHRQAAHMVVSRTPPKKRDNNRIKGWCVCRLFSIIKNKKKGVHLKNPKRQTRMSLPVGVVQLVRGSRFWAASSMCPPGRQRNPGSPLLGDPLFQGLEMLFVFMCTGFGRFEDFGALFEGLGILVPYFRVWGFALFSFVQVLRVWGFGFCRFQLYRF